MFGSFARKMLAGDNVGILLTNSFDWWTKWNQIIIPLFHWINTRKHPQLIKNLRILD